jgi:hypothetical protein
MEESIPGEDFSLAVKDPVSMEEEEVKDDDLARENPGVEPHCWMWCHRTPMLFSTPYIPCIFTMDDTLNLSFVILTIH